MFEKLNEKELLENKLCEYGCGNPAKYKTKLGKYVCEDYCGKCPELIRKNKEKQIGKKVPEWVIEKIKKAKENVPPWNKGLNKYNSEVMRLKGEKLSEKYKNGEIIKKPHPQTEETRKKISETAKKNKKSGGCRKGSGRGKKGLYKGYWCDSSWELAYVIYNLEHNIEFVRNLEGFEYEYNGEKHKYYPDFIENGIYIEIKGYKTDGVNEKVKQFKHSLKVLYEKDMKKYLDYVVEKYGSNYIELYDKKEYIKIEKRKMYKCEKCGRRIYNDNLICYNCSNEPKSQRIGTKTKKKKKKDLCICGKEKLITSKYCNMCANKIPKYVKVQNRPTLEQLEEDLKIMSMVKVGKKYGVSDNAVRKWIKRYKE